MGRSKLSTRSVRTLRRALAFGGVALVTLTGAIAAHSAGNASTTTLKLWMASGTAQETGIADLVKKFEAAHKGVKVQVTYKAFADYTKTIPLRLASPNSPDVLQGNQAYGLDSTLVKRKLIIPIDKYAQQYGWTKLYGPAFLSQYKLRADGNWDGKTALYGVGHHVDFVGVFYNKAKLSELGFAGPPKTLAEFEAVLAKAAAAGERGYLFGNQDGISGTWVLGSLIGHYGNAGYVRNWLNGKPGTTWVNSANRNATNKLLDWVKKGYVTDDFNGVPYPDSITAFTKGEGVFLVTGSWVAGDVLAKLGKDAGFVNFPPGPSGKYQGIGAGSLPWHISARTSNPDLAAELVDTLINAKAGPVLMKHGRIPSFAQSAKAPNALLNEVAAAWQQVRKDSGQLLFIDWSTTTMLTELERGIQEVLGEKISTDEFLTRTQKNWSDFQKTWKT